MLEYAQAEYTEISADGNRAGQVANRLASTPELRGIRWLA